MLHVVGTIPCLVNLISFILLVFIFPQPCFSCHFLSKMNMTVITHTFYIGENYLPGEKEIKSF